MWKRVLDGLLKKNKNRQSFKIGTTDGYYYQIELDRIINLPNLSYSFLEAILAHTQKHNAFEHQHLVDFLQQISEEGITIRNINQYFLKRFAFEPHITVNSPQGKVIEGVYNASKNKFKLKRTPVLFKYQFFFSAASLMVYSLQQMNERQRAEFDKHLNEQLNLHSYLMVKAG